MADDADAPPSAIMAMTAHKLVSLRHGSLLPAPGDSIAAVKYFALYYSAQWCPPCHRFTPQLVKFYNDFKPAHPEFELIFVSEDNDADAMAAYMSEMNMPWLAVEYDALQHGGGFAGSGIQKFVGNGIPDLVLVDASGKVLADSFENGQYVGAQKVMNAIPGIVGAGSAPQTASQ